MKFHWPFKQPPAEATSLEAPIPLDHQGIPILDEVVEPAELGLITEADPNQPDLPLFDSERDETGDAASDRLETLREQLRNELISVIGQTADSVAKRFRTDLEHTLREEIDRVLDKQLPPTGSGQLDRRLD